MRTAIDLDPNASLDGPLPSPTVLTDDGDIVLSFGDVELRMNYRQFDDLYDGMTRWREGKPQARFTVHDDMEGA